MILSAGTRLGPYEIVAPIASGGMGEVYRARDTRLAREVALKIVAEDAEHHAELEARFHEEARLLASVNHANIVAIYDVGSVNEVSYVVFELVEGDTLRHRLANGPLPPATALDHARQIAEGMAAAHERGIVHRDLKPENLVITPRGRIKILDFGIAKGRAAFADDSTDQTLPAITQPGIVLGTIGYMAPEQLRGLAIDQRTDLFAFGVIVYEMLTGTRAFPGRTQVEVLSAILTLDVQNPAATNPSVPSALGEIVMRCLARDAAERFQSSRDLLDALSDPARFGGWAVPPIPVRQPADPRPAVAVLPFVDMSAEKDQEYLCDGIAEEIMSALAHARGLRVVARSSTFQFKGAAHDIRKVGRDLGATAILEGSVRKAQNRIRVAVQLVNPDGGHQIWSERFDRDMTDVLAVQDEIAQKVAEMLEARLAPTAATLAPGRTSDLEAYTDYLKARHHWNRRTEADLDLSVSYFRKALARDPSYARAHAGLADVLVSLAVYGAKAPSDVIPEARSSAERALKLDPDLGSAHACLGLIESLHDWSWSSAARSFRRAIAINRDDAAAHQVLAMNYLVPLGRFDEALTELGLATALDPLSLAVSSTVGVALFYAGRYDDAEQALQATLRLDDRFPLAHMFLSQVRSAQGRFAQALEAIDTAVALAGRTPEMLAALGYALARSGDRFAASLALAELQALSVKRFVSPSAFAELHVGLGDHHAALDALETSARIHTLDMAWLHIRPYFAPLRSEPRFEALVQAMGIAQARQSEANTVAGPPTDR